MPRSVRVSGTGQAAAPAAGPADPRADFVAETVLKRDIFSETVLGHLASNPEVKAVLRSLDKVPWYAGPLARWLARRETRGLRAVRGIEGTPELLAADARGILRVWTAGIPLQLARPADREWYADARRILRQMRRRGVSHNDLAKSQNWLMRPDGGAAVIDFQLAHVHRSPGRLARLAASEDLRHMLKQKRRYAPDLLTPAERRMLARKSLPARIWKATGKRAYNLVTRRLMNWSDGEGFEDLIAAHGDRLARAYRAAGAEEVRLASYPLPSGGVGLYAFVTGPVSLHPPPRTEPRVNLVQRVETLPRRADGEVWDEMLHLVANNRLDEVEQLLEEQPEAAPTVRAIAADRLNLTDRHRR